MLYRYVFVFLLIGYCAPAFAQPATHSVFDYYRLTDSFSHKKDSVNAGVSLLKVDPLYFMFMDQTPDSINVFLLRRFTLTNTAREKYTALFTAAYNATKMESYTKFKAMYMEDIAAKRSAENCGDSLTCDKAAKRIRITDSIHSDYLYNYIKKNGWPSLANGSLYANILALHDHLHYEDYLASLRQGILNGYAAPDVLELMEKMMLSDNGYYFHNKNYQEFAELLKTHAYRRFEISAVLNDRMPSSLSRIEKAVAQLCPANLYYFYEARDKTVYDEWQKKQTKLWMRGSEGIDEAKMADGYNGIMPKLTVSLSRYMCPSKNVIPYKQGLCNPAYHPSENVTPKMILYVIQEK